MGVVNSDSPVATRGMCADAISNAMEGWKKGHSDVLESQHTLILGWSDKVISLVDQLCLANESEGGRPIVVLAELPKEEMEETFSKHVRRHRGSRIICRCPCPSCFSSNEAHL